MSQRQLELEIGYRRAPPHGRGTGRRAAASPAELRHEIDGAARTKSSQMRARKESLEEMLAHRTYTTDSVKRLFAALEKGKAQGL